MQKQSRALRIEENSEKTPPALSLAKRSGDYTVGRPTEATRTATETPKLTIHAYSARRRRLSTPTNSGPWTVSSLLRSCDETVVGKVGGDFASRDSLTMHESSRSEFQYTSLSPSFSADLSSIALSLSIFAVLKTQQPKHQTQGFLRLLHRRCLPPTPWVAFFSAASCFLTKSFFPFPIFVKILN
ncbi:hypothetical protein AAHA92_30125 [Salvia divinorum]|uniref:Uncharacterized protein n=1 Tax=Salvia divinorum TaxID=28513 RepID=A0ABD1G0K2_SALDI